MIYLDYAAVVKLVHAEADSEALRRWLSERADLAWISSVLVEIETFRALARHAPDALARLPHVLDLIDTVDLEPLIRRLARTMTQSACAVWTQFTWPPPYTWAANWSGSSPTTNASLTPLRARASRSVRQPDASSPYQRDGPERSGRTVTKSVGPGGVEPPLAGT
jgi:hypothetical protein